MIALHHYDTDGVTLVAVPVQRIASQVWKGSDGVWNWHLALAVFGGRYIREEGRRATRREAIEAIRDLLSSFFTSVPPTSKLRIERGEERAFPASPSRPFAREELP